MYGAMWSKRSAGSREEHVLLPAFRNRFKTHTPLRSALIPTVRWNGSAKRLARLIRETKRLRSTAV